MHKHVLLRFAAGLLAAATVVLAMPDSSDGHLIIFKDGFSIYGSIKEKKTHVFEPETQQLITIRQGFYLNDGPRIVLFSTKLIADSMDKDLYDRAEEVVLQQKIHRLLNGRLEAALTVNATPWDSKWGRTATVQTEEDQKKIEQRIDYLSPRYFRAIALRYVWSPCYFTREMDVKMVRDLLGNHP